MPLRKDGREEGIWKLTCRSGLGLDATEYEGAVQGGSEDDVQGRGDGSRFVSRRHSFLERVSSCRRADLDASRSLDLRLLRSNYSHDLRNEEPRSLQVQAQVFKSGDSEGLCEEAVCEFRFDSLVQIHLHSSHIRYHFLRKQNRADRLSSVVVFLELDCTGNSHRLPHRQVRSAKSFRSCWSASHSA